MKQSNEKMKWQLTLKDKSPILIIFHSSSLKGSCPLTTKLALNLSIKLSTWFILSSTCELKKKNSLMMKVLKVSYHIANRVVTFVLKYYVELIWISENLKIFKDPPSLYHCLHACSHKEKQIWRKICLTNYTNPTTLVQVYLYAT